MTTFYLLLLIPLLWAIVIKFVMHQSISFAEMFSMFVVSSLIITVVYWTGVYGETRDTLLVNGVVTSKEMNRVSCRHSYSCNCRTRCSGSGKSRSCSTVCDTCYEHRFDQDWDVHSTIGTWSIDTIDRQGLREPPRWTQVVMGEPVSRTESYVNYVKAVPESLFNFNAKLVQDFKGGMPAYPIAVYDYYKVNRLVTHGVSVPDAAYWNYDISKALGDLGPSKQVNGVVVITNNKNSMYAKALQSAWIGGKKNDFVLVIGAPEYPKIEWVSVFGWAKNDIFNVQLRDDVSTIGTVDRVAIVNAIRTNVMQSFVRRSMSDFEYLKERIEPPMWVMITAVILSLLALGWLTWYFHKIDLWKEVFGSRRY